MNPPTTPATLDKPKPGIRDLLQGEQFKAAIGSALPKHLSPDRFIRIALTAMTRTPKLAQCDQASFFQSLLALSQCGIEPDGRRAYLIPFENTRRRVTECQLIISYMGLLELAMRSGDISNVHADKVCQNDLFEFDRGQIVKHKIDFRQPRGTAYAYYAVCRFKDGTEKCEVMTKEEVDAIRKRSRASASGPWVTDYDEMAKKTVFRRLSKWLPLSPEYRDAIEKDADTLDLDASKIEAAKPVFSIDPSEETTEPNPADSLDEPAIPQDPTPPEHTIRSSEPTSARQQLIQALTDASIPEAKFMKAIRKMGSHIKANLIAELPETAAEDALKNIDELIALTEDIK